MSGRDLTAMAAKLAGEAVVADIQTGAVHTVIDGQTWWDTRPMLDPREHSPVVIDMATEAIQYALDAGIATRHPHRSYLLALQTT